MHIVANTGMDKCGITKRKLPVHPHASRKWALQSFFTVISRAGFNKLHFWTGDFQRPLYILPRNFRGLMASEITKIFQRSILRRPVRARYLASLGVSVKRGWSWLNYCRRGRQAGVFTATAQASFHYPGTKKTQPRKAVLHSAPPSPAPASPSPNLGVPGVPRRGTLAEGSPPPRVPMHSSHPPGGKSGIKHRAGSATADS